MATSDLESNSQTWSTCRHVAWIRVGAIGDLVVGLASLVETHRLFPNAEITVVGPKLWTQLLSPESFPFVTRIAAIERKKTFAEIFVPAATPGEIAAASLATRQDRSSDSSHAVVLANRLPSSADTIPRSWLSTLQNIELHEVLRECDAMVNTNIDSSRYGIAGLRAGVKVRVGSASPAMAWLYTHASPHFGKDPLVHEKNVPLLLLEYAKKGIARFTTSTATYRAHLNDYVKQSELVKRWSDQGLPAMKQFSHERLLALTGHKPKSYVLINPTASRREKTWPTDRVFELLRACEADMREAQVSPIVIGAPNEAEWLKEVARDRYPVIQPQNLSDLQEIVHGARMLFTNGSSMQFIAGTTKTPTLTVFGRGQPLIWGPVGKFDLTVRAKFDNATAGSTFAGFEEESRIYRTIQVEEVKTAFLKLLDLAPTTP